MKSSFLAGGLLVLALTLPCRAQLPDPSCLPGLPEAKPEVTGRNLRQVTLPDCPAPTPMIVMEEPVLVGNPVTPPEYPRVWAEFDYLLWWLKPNKLPPLVTSTRQPEDLAATLTAGGLDDPNAFVLFGNEGFRKDPQSGGRVTLGFALNTDGTDAIEASGFYLPRRLDHFDVSSDANGNPALGLSFRQVFPGTPAETAGIIAGPFGGTVRQGFISIGNGTEMWGGELNCVKFLDNTCVGEFDLIAGVRYAFLRDFLTIDAGTLPIAVNGATSDFFEGQNSFYGGQLGLRHILESEHWRLQTTAKFALGDTHEILEINGSSVLPSFAAGSTLPGGFYTAGSNIGRDTRDRLGFMQETGVNLTYKFTDKCQLTVGYTFLFWNRVLRSGSQIDRNLNPALNPAFSTLTAAGGPASPQRLNAESEFWAQGLNFGLRFAW